MGRILITIFLILCFSDAHCAPFHLSARKKKNARLFFDALCNAHQHDLQLDSRRITIDPNIIKNHEEYDNSIHNTNGNILVSPSVTENYGPEINAVLKLNAGRFICIESPRFPHCDIFLCGTLHVANSSVAFVRSAIRSVAPHFVVLELCEERMDVLVEPVEPVVFNHSLGEVLRSTLQHRSWKLFGMELLSWMQAKSAKLLNVKLGGELCVAAHEGFKVGAAVVLGDRKYSVTMQRIFDRLSLFDKIKIGVMFVWEALTMSLRKVQEYVRNTENPGVQFVQDEVEQFAKYMPALADVVIFERDEYLAQSILELARTGFGPLPERTAADIDSSDPNSDSNSNDGSNRSRDSKTSSSNDYIKRLNRPRGKILAVVGAGHLEGIKKRLLLSTDDHSSREEHMREISKSSRDAATWPGAGMLHVVDMKEIYKLSAK